MQIKIDKMGQIKKRMEKAWNLKREKKREWKSERKCIVNSIEK